MPSYTPWKDDKWLPGVLNKEQMEALKHAHLLLEANHQIEEDASALDLHLSGTGYEMIQGSIKPFNKNYKDIISDLNYAKPMESTDDSFSLKREHCYVFKVKERLHPCIKNTPIYGQATAKSTVGRVDVIARLIVDGMKEYETFIPEEVNSGEMFIEITPITFNVKVRVGESLSQLRFFYGKIEYSIINDEGFISSILNLRDGERNHGTLSVDLSEAKVNSKETASAFIAKKEDAGGENRGDEIELWGEKKYSPEKFWYLGKANEEKGLKSIKIQRDHFYILRSVEEIALPRGVCIYCRAMDETLGEMRIHYAGFVHPLFGKNRKDGRHGAPLIFEVRGHNVDVLLTHGEILARLYFYRMSKDVQEDEYYKKKSEKEEKSVQLDGYSNQELTLSKFFKKWGEKNSND